MATLYHVCKNISTDMYASDENGRHFHIMVCLRKWKIKKYNKYLILWDDVTKCGCSIMNKILDYAVNYTVG